MMKNGNREGNTTSHHIFNPRMEACKAAWGGVREKVKNSVDMVRKRFPFFIHGKSPLSQKRSFQYTWIRGEFRP